LKCESIVTERETLTRGDGSGLWEVSFPSAREGERDPAGRGVGGGRCASFVEFALRLVYLVMDFDFLVR